MDLRRALTMPVLPWRRSASSACMGRLQSRCRRSLRHSYYFWSQKTLRSPSTCTSTGILDCLFSFRSSVVRVYDGITSVLQHGRRLEAVALWCLVLENVCTACPLAGALLPPPGFVEGTLQFVEQKCVVGAICVCMTEIPIRTINTTGTKQQHSFCLYQIF